MVKSRGRRSSSRLSSNRGDGVDEPPMDQWSDETHLTGPPFIPLFDYPPEPNKVIKVVALIDKKTSNEMVRIGYTCRVCGSRSDRLVVGSLNRGGRLSPHCITCLVAPTTEHWPDPGNVHNMNYINHQGRNTNLNNNYHISPWLHSPRWIVEEVQAAVQDSTCDWMPRRIRIKHQLRKVGSMGGKTVRPCVLQGGCKDKDCSGCSHVNDLLKSWLPEITPWYGTVPIDTTT